MFMMRMVKMLLFEGRLEYLLYLLTVDLLVGCLLDKWYYEMFFVVKVDSFFEFLLNVDD